jgi:hypothetical protein
MSTMFVVINPVESVVVDWVLVMVDPDVEDYEHIVLVHSLLVENLTHHNLLVVFFDNNLFQ